MSPIVLVAGITTCGLQLAIQALSFFGPHVGCRLRAATMKSSSSSETFVGLVNGRHDRDCAARRSRCSRYRPNQS
jgi:hypothetical protein